MLHILVSILRIIGIILLVILGIVMTLLLLVLFVPIRYRADAVINEEQSAHAKIRWLLRMFGVDVSYVDKKLCITARLFWFFKLQLVPSEPKKPKKTKVVAQNSPKERSQQTSNKAIQVESSGEITQTPKSSTASAPVSEQKNAPKPIEEQAIVKEAPISTTETVIPEQQNSKKKTGVFKKIIGFPAKILQKIRAAIEKVKYTFRTICDKITNIKGQTDYYLELLQREQTKQAFALCKNELFRIIRHILPGKISGEFVLGMEDPATTGQIYGIYCAAMMLHKNRIRLIPDFDHKIMNGDVHIKGRIRLITLVFAGIKIILDKNIRYLIKTLKQKQGGI